jgi:hypothetical protein
MKTSNKFYNDDVKAKNSLPKKAGTEKISDRNKQLMKKVLSLVAVVTVIIFSVLTAYASTKETPTVYQYVPVNESALLNWTATLSLSGDPENGSTFTATLTNPITVDENTFAFSDFTVNGTPVSPDENDVIHFESGAALAASGSNVTIPLTTGSNSIRISATATKTGESMWDSSEWNTAVNEAGFHYSINLTSQKLIDVSSFGDSLTITPTVESTVSAYRWQNGAGAFLNGKNDVGYDYGSFNLSESLKSDIKNATSINAIITFSSPIKRTASIGIYLGTANGTNKSQYEERHDTALAISTNHTNYAFNNITLYKEDNGIDVFYDKWLIALGRSYGSDEDNAEVIIESIVLEITLPSAPPPDSEGQEDTTTTTTEATTTTESEDTSGDTTNDPASDEPYRDDDSKRPDKHDKNDDTTAPVTTVSTTAPVTTVSTTAPTTISAVTETSITEPEGDSAATESSPPDTQIVAESLLPTEKNPPTGAAFPTSLMIALAIICVVIIVMCVGFHKKNK